MSPKTPPPSSRREARAAAARRPGRRTAPGGRASQRRPSGRRPSGRRRRSTGSRVRRVLIWLLALGLAGIAGLAAAFAIAYARTSLPEPNDFADAQSTILYYADGQTELARFTGGYDRESVTLDQVPDHVQKAVLAAEDRTFYENQGVSITGTVRAAYRSFTGGGLQGGSTITQQYVKNYYLNADQTLGRKVKELLIAVKIDNEQSKEQILENYLNTIYFGRGAYGVQTASHAYFRKDVDELTVAEGAFLASVTNAPSLFDPDYADGNEERAQARVEYVLDGMVEEGWLSAQDRAAASFPKIAKTPPSTAVQGVNGYVAQAVRSDLRTLLGIEDAQIDSSGLRVTTTIVKKHQDAAKAAIKEFRPTGQGTDDLTLALTALRPGDGAITAMYGGDDFQKTQLNAATDAQVQAGSLFKPITLVAAVADGVDTLTTFPGPSPMTFTVDQAAGTTVDVRNFRELSFGTLDLRVALAESVNTIYVALNQEIGPDRTVQAAIDLGLPEDTPGLGPDLTNVLGTASPTLVEMTNAYATIAAEGQRATPYLVSKVVDVSGETTFEADPETSRGIDPDVAADVTDAMTYVMTQGSGMTAGDIGRPSAGKSGTSENNVSAWFDGFVPQLAAGVVMYKGDGTVPMQEVAGVDQVTGGTFPAQVWGEFMRRAMEGEDVVAFPERVGVGDVLQTTEAPVEEEPVTQAPTTSDEPTQTTDEPSETTSAEPTTPEPTTPEPTTPEPTTPEPTTPEPTTPEPPTVDPPGNGPPGGGPPGQGEAPAPTG